MRLPVLAAVGAAIVMAQFGVAGAAPPSSKAPNNKANDYLLKLSPDQQAAWLARTVGEWCIATEPFEMGVSDRGPSTGYAYWSFRCINGGSYVVQLEPGGHGIAIDCDSFKKNGAGKECFKKF